MSSFCYLRCIDMPGVFKVTNFGLRDRFYEQVKQLRLDDG